MKTKDFVKEITKDVNATYTSEGKKNLTEGNVSDVLKSFTKVTTDVLAKGDSVSLAGFGTFSPKDCSARTGHNPKTGESIQIPARTVPKFKAAKALKDAVAGK